MRLSLLRVSAVAICAPMFAVSCTSDLPAPDCYNDPCQITGLESATAGGDIAIDCSDIPDAALLATYDYTPAVMGGDDMYTFMATNLPMGMTIDATTGQITGTPTQVGAASVEIQVMDVTGNSGSQICDFNVNGALDVDYDELQLAPPFCIRPGASLLDYVVDGTGDGSPITCATPTGSGNGNLPAGITVNPDTCEIEGTITEDRYGTYVWIVQGNQSGRQVWAPYCVTQNMQDMGAYNVTVEQASLAADMVDATLVPIIRTFSPMADFMVGEVDDPRFEVVSPTSCGGNACFYGFAFSINASPFDIDTGNLLGPNALLNNGAGEPIGFYHELRLNGPSDAARPMFAENFGDRAWVVNLGIDYCIDSVEANCMGANNIRDNGNGNIEMAVLMFPQ